MRSFRTIIVLFCLLLMVLPLVSACIFEARKMIIRHEMEESLEKEQLVTLSLSASDIKWYKKGKELLIGSSLFDVKSFTRTSSGYVVTGLFDEKEKQIKEYLEELAEEEEKKSKEKKIPVFQSWYHEEPVASDQAQQKKSLLTYPVYSEQPFDTSYPVVIPPPKFSLAA